MVDENFPKFILLALTDADFCDTTKCLAKQGSTIFLAKNENDDGIIFYAPRYVGVSITYNWRCMLSEYGRLYQAADWTWKITTRELGFDIELVLKQENSENVIAQKHMHIFAPRTRFDVVQVALLLSQVSPP
ncbi:unnamed protein product [Eruca vesicaria subsp. sativa]|uniref:Uncharacterized protein n=1 Tax=Eruca vesicaria subsp. sativa TaxID=29727 RepID=A0ABC8KHB9_ERUVS|nr:unnamed protein product [Eruca vesicaria subsp. sativa]